MTVKSPTKFDVEEFARAYGQWDVDALIGLYADDLELVQIDRDNPPSAPRAGSRTLDGLGASRRGWSSTRWLPSLMSRQLTDLRSGASDEIAQRDHGPLLVREPSNACSAALASRR